MQDGVDFYLKRMQPGVSCEFVFEVSDDHPKILFGDTVLNPLIQADRELSPHGSFIQVISSSDSQAVQKSKMAIGKIVLSDLNYWSSISRSSKPQVF